MPETSKLKSGGKKTKVCKRKEELNTHLLPPKQSEDSECKLSQEEMKRKSVRSQIKDQTEESVVTLAGNKKQFWGSPGGSDGTESAFNAGDLDLIPGSGRSWNNTVASSVKASLKVVHVKKKNKYIYIYIFFFKFLKKKSASVLSL